MISLFQTASGAWHLPSILTVSGWLLGTLVTGAFIFANLKVNRDDRITSFEKEQQSILESHEAQARIAELESKQQPRRISEEQRKAFVAATKDGPFGPVVLATRGAFPSKEPEDFTMDLRRMLDAAGFGNNGSDIVNGFGTGTDPERFLMFISSSDSPPSYFSNIASALYEMGLVSPDVPVAINNPNAKEDLLYLFIPEK